MTKCDELNDYLKSNYQKHEPEKENCVLENYIRGVLEEIRVNDW